MYSLYKQINGILNFKMRNKNLAYYTLTNDLIFNFKKIIEQNESYFLIDELIGYHTRNNETYFFNGSGEKVKSFDVIFYPEYLIDNTFTSSKSYFRNESGNWESDLYLFNYKPFFEVKKFKGKIEGGNILRIGNEFIQHGKQYLKFLNEDAILKWKFDLSSLGTSVNYDNQDTPIEVDAFIGVFEDLLWVYLNNGKILGLHTKTGEKIHLLNGVNRQNVSGPFDEYLEEKENLIFLNTKYTLDNTTGIIHGLIYDKYYQINVSQEPVTSLIFGLQDILKEAGISPGSINRTYQFVNNKIYFAAYEQGQFGVFNTITKKIEYMSDKFSDYRLKDIQVSDNKVAILDLNNTLHIFEKV